jgi:hypothetical protein
MQEPLLDFITLLDGYGAASVRVDHGWVRAAA